MRSGEWQITTKFYPHSEAEQACLLEWLNTEAWYPAFVEWQEKLLARMEAARQFTPDDQVRAHAMGVEL